MNKKLKKKVKEVLEKYKADNEQVKNDQPVPAKHIPKQQGGFTARPDKKRG